MFKIVIREGRETALTEMAVRNAKAPENGGNYSLSDGDGLMLLVKKSGAKSWALRYWLDGKEKRSGLGPYPLNRAC